ncbi:hybrid sensor histidine kinase/response regulator [Pseudoalteromonas piscicida]|uniref:histidine kinase n=1 Tax=Pseudoalteromonas piscicida TaxID=43662 RepID=A0A2A5JPU5_PSEO7|nr:ATP-binding protein [Pseudoalteromonas piscicida]PCK31349.1 hybrid sensor histidine kinase/response regulator [Pseudoalteromonas piscicida]
MNQQQPLSFLSVSEHTAPTTEAPIQPWVVLVVDDEPEVHDVTKLVLSSYRFESRPLELLHAYSKNEALAVLKSRDDIALILLDVIMESEEAGLECVQCIREELGYRNVRIVLRTGQPGSIPEHELMLRFDINDYKNKTDLTKSRLFTLLTSSLRSYRDIKRLESLTEALTSLNEGLEEKVKQRTHELESSNQALKDAYNRIAQQQQALIQSEKLASVGQFAAGVAHEINNPLAYLKSNLEFVQGALVKLYRAWQFLANNAQLSPDSVNALHEIEREYQLNWTLSESDDVMAEMHAGLDRIQLIVKELSVFFESNQTQLQLVDFHSQILDSVMINLELDGVNLGLIELNRCEPLELHCAPALLEHSLYCLIKNALESTGRVRKGIHVKTMVEDETLIIDISDCGEGIAEKLVHRVFDPFYTTKASDNHVGLGLTVASNIIKSHGGQLSIKSTVGVGTIATIQLPII